ncbi:unnamed protein product [Ascophyllum nodosum]
MTGSGRNVVAMALAALLPIAVIVGIVLGGRGEHGPWHNRSYGRRGARPGFSGRRLQSTSKFATQLEMTVCLTDDHTSESASSTADQWKTAIVGFFSIDNEDYVQVDDSVTRCEVDDWQRRISIYNEADENGTAADVASNQVDSIYPNTDEKTTEFFTSVSTSIDEQDVELAAPEASDFELLSLGFLVIWLDSNGDVVSSQGTTEDRDVVNIGGTDVWWPWWAWLIYAAVVLCCICPMLFFFFKWRRDKEAEAEMQSQVGKEVGTPAPPSATSTNPYGAGTAEEYKTGKA